MNHGALNEPHVQNGCNNQLALLDELDLRYGTYSIWEYCLDKHRPA